jgi:hypothetical protein
MRKTRKMQNAQDPELKQEIRPANQFDEAEYKRWSEKFRPLKPVESDWGIEKFLGRTEKPLTDSVHHD